MEMVEGVTWGSWRWWNFAAGWREEKEKEEEQEGHEPGPCGWRQRALHLWNGEKQGREKKKSDACEGYGKKMEGSVMREMKSINGKQETHEGM